MNLPKVLRKFTDGFFLKINVWDGKTLFPNVAKVYNWLVGKRR
jgi:hypothetical protein